MYTATQKAIDTFFNEKLRGHEFQIAKGDMDIEERQAWQLELSQSMDCAMSDLEISNHSAVMDDARQLIKAHKLGIKVNTDDYNEFCRDLLRAKVDAFASMINQLDDAPPAYREIPGEPLIVGLEHRDIITIHEAARMYKKTSKTILNWINEYKRENGRDPLWACSADGQVQYMINWRLLEEWIKTGDNKRLKTLNRKN